MYQQREEIMKGKSKSRQCGLLAALFLFWCVTCAAREPKVVTWTAVKQEISRYICIVNDTATDGSVSLYYKHGIDSPCVEGPEQVPGIAAILAEAQPLLIGIQPEDVGFSHDTTLTLDSQQCLLQNAYLSSEWFLRPIVRRLERRFASQGIVCSDCPVFAEKPVRVVPVAEFLPYLVAYAWPDEIHTPDAINNGGKGELHLTFHVCVYINGVDQTIEHPDRYLSYLAWTAAVNSKQFMNLASEHFEKLVQEESYQRLANDSTRTSYVRQHLGDRLGQDKRLIAVAKRFLKKYYDDLFVLLE
jgi:hypothetical protein